MTVAFLYPSRSKPEETGDNKNDRFRFRQYTRNKLERVKDKIHGKDTPTPNKVQPQAQPQPQNPIEANQPPMVQYISTTTQSKKVIYNQVSKLPPPPIPIYDTNKITPIESDTRFVKFHVK